MTKSFHDHKLAKNFETVSLSHQTVSKKTAEISKQLDAQLSTEIAQRKYFSVVLDESTDITYVCQLCQFLPVRKAHIYSARVLVVEKYGGFSKCSCIVTDNAKSMTDKNTGLVWLLRQNDDVPVLHCIIHHNVLCRKFVKMNNVMKDSSTPQELNEISAEFHDIPLHSEIRWLSADPMAVTIEDQDPELQMELYKRKSDVQLSTKQILTHGQLWNFVMPEEYPKFHNLALTVTSMFGSTYICECAFLTMKMLKSKQRNRLFQDPLKSNLRIVTTEMEADIVGLVNEHTAQCSH
ncbi:hypothetical protein PR048_028844 [Dryococelus australis]|uniref:HAT C-terminal dimerisation domain-containing protein n=1 Tax=Dryococelus australis TaxID=614101 RepID=A0ABQ9GBP5_9NEOP|nr:hypothetical protein PR048_028844 [Dryococelus australis]